jgi:rubrerythrin
VDEATKSALDEALDDEYKARATYRAVLDRFGEVRPFSNIVEAEGRHIEALLAVYRRHDVEPPEDGWAGNVDAPESVEAACRQGVEAELANDAMYARLLDVVRDPDIRETMTRLRDASRERHLPAFQRCVERGGGRGMGRGRGPGHGRGHRRGGGRGQ